MDIGCNRLENAVKPQPASDLIANAQSCNRLENAVKPQLEKMSIHSLKSCNRLENAVKPQQQLSMEFPEKVVTD